MLYKSVSGMICYRDHVPNRHHRNDVRKIGRFTGAVDFGGKTHLHPGYRVRWAPRVGRAVNRELQVPSGVYNRYSLAVVAWAKLHINLIRFSFWV